MPWGHPDATEALWCLTCGTVGPEYRQRTVLRGGVPTPTPRVRICPPCFEAGWRLCQDGIETGTYYPVRRSGTSPRVAKPDAEAPVGLWTPKAGRHWRRVEEAGRV